MLGPDADHLVCVAAATSCQVHLQLQVQEDTTKDTDNDWLIQEPVGISWDARVEALVVLDHEETGLTADALTPGAVYVLRFTQTAGAAGQQNRDAIANVLQLTGEAILNDLQLNAQVGDLSTATAQFTGHGDLTPYTPSE